MNRQTAAGWAIPTVASAGSRQVDAGDARLPGILPQLEPAERSVSGSKVRLWSLGSFAGRDPC
jgi:hypothetical protein